MDSRSGWQGSEPHHHYNMGTASGSWWSGELDAEGIPDTTMRDGTPNGYAFIEFAPEGYVIDYQAARESADSIMRITGPGTVVAGSFPQADVYVNVFNGSDRNQLRYRIDNGSWQPMQKVDEKDPELQLLTIRNLLKTGARTNYRLTPATNSTHLWKARLSTSINPGEHFIVVSSTDMFGRETRLSQAFMVQASGF